MKQTNSIKLQESNFTNNIFPTLNYKKIWFFIAVLIVTFISHYSNIDNEYSSWDDTHFISNNPYIRELSVENLQKSYQKNKSESILAFVSWSVEYKYWGLNPHVMHLNNLILHLLNSISVFMLMLLLSKQYWASILSTVIFAIHPMHAEAVNWIAGRTWLLCGFGFFQCLIFYHLYNAYLFKRKYFPAFWFYFFSLLFFAATLLSQAAGFVIAPILFLFDFFYNRKIKLPLFVEKIPYFLMAAVSFIILIKTRGTTGEEPLLTSVHYSFYERIFVSSYSFIFHFYKIVLPNNLSAFYPLIDKTDGSLPIWLYVFPLLILIYIFIAFYSLKRNKIIFFGLAFYAVNIFPLIRLMPVQSEYLMADRYTYISHFGLGYIIGWFLNTIIEQKINFKKYFRISILILFGMVSIIFSYLSWVRGQVWDNDISLWTDVLKKYPRVIAGYNNRGLAYLGQKKYDLALNDFHNTIKLDPKNLRALNNLGVVYDEMGDYQKSLENYNLVLSYDPYNYEAYYNRGVCYGHKNLFAEALLDLDKSIQIKPDYAAAYNNRGIVYALTGNHQRSVEDFSKAIEFKQDNGQAFYNRAIAYFNLKNYKYAYNDVKSAEKLGIAPEPALMNEIIKKVKE